MISFEHKGDFKETNNFIKNAVNSIKIDKLDYYGREGVAALRSATPRDTGLTAESWSYRIVRTDQMVRIDFLNSNRNNGVPIAILIQYGHATRNGTFVAGRDFINPAIQPIFDELAKKVWKEVTDR